MGRALLKNANARPSERAAGRPALEKLASQNPISGAVKACLATGSAFVVPLSGPEQAEQTLDMLKAIGLAKRATLTAPSEDGRYFLAVQPGAKVVLTVPPALLVEDAIEKAQD